MNVSPSTRDLIAEADQMLADRRVEREAHRDIELAVQYVLEAKGDDPTIGVTRKWNDDDVRRAYVAGRREMRDEVRS